MITIVILLVFLFRSTSFNSAFSKYKSCNSLLTFLDNNNEYFSLIAFISLPKDNNLFFVTARNYSLTQITQDWLKKQQLSQIPLYSLGTDNKLHKANELKCDIFIEDHPNNALNLANGGIKVILIDCNYNKGVEHQNITRVSSWKEIKDVIDKL